MSCQKLYAVIYFTSVNPLKKFNEDLMTYKLYSSNKKSRRLFSCFFQIHYGTNITYKLLFITISILRANVRGM